MLSLRARYTAKRVHGSGQVKPRDARTRRFRGDFAAREPCGTSTRRRILECVFPAPGRANIQSSSAQNNRRGYLNSLPSSRDGIDVAEVMKDALRRYPDALTLEGGVGMTGCLRGSLADL